MQIEILFIYEIIRNAFLSSFKLRRNDKYAEKKKEKKI